MMAFRSGDVLVSKNGTSRGGIIWIVEELVPESPGGLDWDTYRLRDPRDNEISQIDSYLVEAKLRKVELSKLYRLVLGLEHD